MTFVLIVAVSAALSLVMMAAWVVQQRTGKASWVDAVWSFGLGGAGVVYALMPAPGIAWPGPRQLAVATLVLIWSLRLGGHLVQRARQGREDSRYVRFKQEWGASFERRMFWFLQIQAAASLTLALSILAAARRPAPFDIGDWLAVAIFAMAILGEAVADAQLQGSRRDEANRNAICERGLWRWSRHPNYFFEWVGWLAYPLFAIDWHGTYLWGWAALSGPVLMYILLVHVSGIPPLEEEMLRSRGDAYRAYQARTRAFFPVPQARPS
jgi:steroid 5-alpha reductase family enzyme